MIQFLFVIIQTSLVQLFLGRTRLTDEGLAHLKGLSMCVCVYELLSSKGNYFQL